MSVFQTADGAGVSRVDSLDRHPLAQRPAQDGLQETPIDELVSHPMELGVNFSIIDELEVLNHNGGLLLQSKVN